MKTYGDDGSDEGSGIDGIFGGGGINDVLCVGSPS
jgi:hypothetical protein